VRRERGVRWRRQKVFFPRASAQDIREAYKPNGFSLGSRPQGFGRNCGVDPDRSEKPLLGAVRGKGPFGRVEWRAQRKGDGLFGGILRIVNVESGAAYRKDSKTIPI